MTWDQEMIRNIGYFPGRGASVAPAPLSRLGPAGKVPPGEAARFGADEDLPQGGGARIMQWAAALAPPRSLGSWLGTGHGQGKWPRWPEQALDGLGAMHGTGPAFHRALGGLPELLAFLASPRLFATTFPMDSIDGAQNLNAKSI